jgi:DNA-binding transcriptional LysR family regulator
MTSTESILALVRLNLSVALVPALMLDAMKPKGVIARRFEPPVTLTFGFCYVKQKYPSALLRTFLSFTKSHWRRP